MHRLSILLLFVSFGACGSFAPKPEDTVGKPKPVYTELLDQRRGELVLQENGLWAFVASDPSKIAKIPRGTIFVYANVDSRAHHFFGVVRTEQWGYSLQRLDTESLEGDAARDLIPLATVDRQVAKRWDLCIDVECFDTSREGVYWHVYSFDGDRLRTDVGDDLGVMPFARAALLYAGVFERTVFGEMPKSFVAIPGAIRAQPARPVVAQRGCDVQDKRVISVPFDEQVKDHPIDVAAQAMRHHADAIAVCADGKTTAAIPALFRQPMSGAIVAASQIGIVMGARRQTSKSIPFVDVAAYAGTGDYIVADFYLEHAARDAKHLHDTLLLDAADVVVAADRPEAALRLARFATEKQWDRRANARYVLVRSRIEDRVGDARSGAARRTDLAGIVKRERDDRFANYLAFFGFRAALARSKQPQVIQELSPDWQLTYAVESVRQGVTPGAAVDDDRVAILVDAIGGTFLPSPKFANAYSYSKSDDAIDRISTRPSLFDRGFTFERWNELASSYDGITRVQVAVATIHTLDFEAREEASDAILNWVKAVPCGEEGSDQKTQQLARHLGLFRFEPSDPASDIAWMVSEAMSKRCEENFVDLVRGASKTSVSRGRIGLALLVDQFEQAKSIPFSVADGLFRFAHESVRGEACLRFGIATAIKLVEARNFEEAHARAAKSGECIETPDADQTFLSAYLHFEKTRAISEDYERDVRNRVAEITSVVPKKSVCTGAGAFAYVWRDALSKSILGFADKIEAAPEKRDVMRLLFASDLVNEGKTALSNVAAAVVADDITKARAELDVATNRFTSAGHRPGLRRAEFLKGYLFEFDAEKKTKRRFEEIKTAEAAKSESAKAARFVLFGDPLPASATSVEALCRPLDFAEKELE